MFYGNISGFTVSLYTTLTAYALADNKAQNLILALLLTFAPAILLLGVISSFVLTGDKAAVMWGFTCNAITIMYYAAPLSTAVSVIRSKSSSSIYLPMCIANLVNTLLWIGYGMAVKDPFVWLPNSIGGAFAVVLCALCLVYPNKEPERVDQSMPSIRAGKDADVDKPTKGGRTDSYTARTGSKTGKPADLYIDNQQVCTDARPTPRTSQMQINRRASAQITSPGRVV